MVIAEHKGVSTTSSNANPAQLAHILDKQPGRYGIYAKNLRTGTTIAYNEHLSFPSASLIKVPIMIEIFRRVEEDNLSLDQTLTLRAEDRVPGSGVLHDLTPGTSYVLRDLTTLMITVSDNTATNLLIDYCGVETINHTTQSLGAHNTELVRKLQRVPAIRPTTNRTTAYDIALLMEHIARGTAISQAASQAMAHVLRRCQSPLRIGPSPSEPQYSGQPERIVAAHKTGSLSDACHDAGIMYLPKVSYVAAILSHGAPEDRLARTVSRIGRRFPVWLT